MKYFKPFITFFFIGILAVLFFHVDKPINLQTSAKKKLVIYAYSSFTQAWGAGPELVTKFQEFCHCQVELIDAGDSGILLQKLKFEGFSVDLVIGLDQLSIIEGYHAVKWQDPKAEFFQSKNWHSNFKDWQKSHPFIPFDWSPLTFIYRKKDFVPPSRLEQLLDPKFSQKFTLQDPRTSTLGFQFLMWMISEMGEEKAFQFLKDFKPNVFSVSQSWSTAYGLFQQKQVPATFSYLTSLIYHWTEEKNATDYGVVNFSSGHPYQVEYAGVPASCKNCELAQEFMEFMLTPLAQEKLLRKNYMLPVIELIPRPPELKDLPELKTKTLMPVTDIEQKKRWLERWKALW